MDVMGRVTRFSFVPNSLAEKRPIQVLSMMRVPWIRCIQLVVLFVVRSHGDDAEYYQKYFEVCADALIQVEDVSLLCDSPGAYYYGNGKYRNSETCALGDKAHVKIYFYIGQDLQGTEPYVTLLVTDTSGSDMHDVSIFQDVLLCSVSGLTSQNGQACPGEGYYYIYQTAYLGERGSGDNQLDAIASIGFQSDPDSVFFNLGGANTDYCHAGSYGRYSYAKIGKQLANAVASFLVTWGTLFFGVISILGFIGFLVSRIRKRNDVTFEDADEDLLAGNFNQVIVMSSSRSLVDF